MDGTIIACSSKIKKSILFAGKVMSSVLCKARKRGGGSLVEVFMREDDILSCYTSLVRWRVFFLPASTP